MSWDRFVDERPSEPVLMRVYAAPSDYYNFEFANEGEWVSFGITDRDERFLLYGFARRGSETATELQAVASRPSSSARMIVSARST